MKIPKRVGDSGQPLLDAKLGHECVGQAARQLDAHGDLRIQSLHSLHELVAHPDAPQLLPQLVTWNGVVCLLEIDKAREEGHLALPAHSR